jgi:hypothetical protein
MGTDEIVALIVDAYPTKGRKWATNQWERASRNADSPTDTETQQELLKGEFGIS